jgi:23S rRNA (cytidine1920-2'-O)/16S rRNA (cytidine1409-2'-O)-methyltransferase
MALVQKQRLDTRLVEIGLVSTRSQAESYIKLSTVLVNGQIINKPSYMVSTSQNIKITQATQYVSRAGLKLESIAQQFNLDFIDKTVLDVGSSTGGFTDYSLRHGAKKVTAIELGTNQMHPSLRSNPKVELHEKTDIRLVLPSTSEQKGLTLSFTPDIVVIDLSFISLREVLPHIAKLVDRNTLIVAMVKPQFEAENIGLKHKGVVKNESLRRQILKDFEAWAKSLFVIIDKSDSKVAGARGNLERFYLLSKTA